MIESVVTEGTAKNAQVAGFSIGGKTGTSEKIDVLDENGQPTLDKIVSFVGIAPMDDPQYIVLVALDTPSRSTGIYISGGVMAAPTVGAVLSDILPYLGVPQNFPEGDIRGKVMSMEDLSGLTKDQAKKRLKELGLEGVFSGDAETVTGQIPAAGQQVSGGNQVLIYLGEETASQPVKMPDFRGMHRQQAWDTAGKLGLHIISRGNTDLLPTVTVSFQDIPPGTEVTSGTTVTLTFTDTAHSD